MIFKSNSIYIILISIIILLVASLVGTNNITISKLLYDPFFQNIFFEIRVPRMLLAFCIGGILSICGSVYQALFRNPLATPYTLGISSGASLANACLMIFPYLQNFCLKNGFQASFLMAFVGGMFSFAVIMGISKITKTINSEILLLTGVALNFFFSGLVMFIQYIASFTENAKITRWLMGSFEVYGYSSVIISLLFGLGGLLYCYFLASEIDLIGVGEDFAISRGVNLKRVKMSLLLVTSFLISLAVSISGPIAFVGMIIPHVTRMVFGNSHRGLIINSYFLGGSFLVICDTLGRTLIAPGDIPVGVLTSLFGGPFFLYILFKKFIGNR